MALQTKKEKKIGGSAKEGKKQPISEINKAENQEFVIQKGIPIPKRADRDSLVSKFPLLIMDIGDSFVVKKPYSRVIQNSISCSIRQFVKGKKKQIRFSVLKDVETGYLRVWRVK